MMNCDLCKKIWKSKDEYRDQFKPDWWDEEIGIVMKNNEPWLYIPVDDKYYSDTYMQINFCPKFGRRVNPNYEVVR